MLTPTSVNPIEVNKVYAFQLLRGVAVPGDGSRTVSVRCNLSGSIPSGVAFRFDLLDDSMLGVTVDNAVREGAIMTTLKHGHLEVSPDSSTPSRYIAVAGTKDTTLAVLRLSAVGEDMRLHTLGLKFGHPDKASGRDLFSVNLYQGPTKVGGCAFTVSSDTCVVTLYRGVIVSKDDALRIWVKGDMSKIGLSSPGNPGALVSVTWDAEAKSPANQAVGMQSGQVVSLSGEPFDTAGVILQRSQPMLIVMQNMPTDVVRGHQSLWKFAIRADEAGDIAIGKVSFPIALNRAAEIRNLGLYIYTDDTYATPAPGTVGADGNAAQYTVDLDGGSDEVVSFWTADQRGVPISIPAGETYYFSLEGTLAGEEYGTVDIAFAGDYSSDPQMRSALGARSNQVSFLWSANSTGQITRYQDVDWTDGSHVIGLPATGYERLVWYEWYSKE